MVENPRIERKLTTILAADAANYSGRMAADEVETVRALRKSFFAMTKLIEMRGGRIANTAGDGLIAEFPSVVEATAAAVAIQKELGRDPGHLDFRIGLHLGDVIVEGDDLLGDGVNLAARLQEIAPEGGVIVSQQIVDHARGRLAAEFRPLGPKSLKHLPGDIAVYGVVADGVVAPNDLAPVIPHVTSVAGRVKAEKRFGWIPKKSLGMIVFFIVLDIATGPGSWAFWPVAILSGYVVLNWYRAR